jgi:hypothetical protein
VGHGPTPADQGNAARSSIPTATPITAARPTDATTTRRTDPSTARRSEGPAPPQRIDAPPPVPRYRQRHRSRPPNWLTPHPSRTDPSTARRSDGPDRSFRPASIRKPTPSPPDSSPIRPITATPQSSKTALPRIPEPPKRALPRFRVNLTPSGELSAGMVLSSPGWRLPARSRPAPGNLNAQNMDVRIGGGDFSGRV